MTVSACGAGDEDAGVRANEVCGRFARAPAVASALAKLAGTERFNEDLSEPAEAIAKLRAADGKYNEHEDLWEVPECLLRAPEGGYPLVTLYFREALVVLKPQPAFFKDYTYYRTGASAASLHRAVSIYFHCRMTKPEKKSIIINARLERESKVKLSGRSEVDAQMLVANTAALKMARQVGCQGTDLSQSPPQAISGLYGPH
ncbi:hypothetical protein EV284_2286 [Streptomyces sp. BK022]|uniref:hypothetical protein n=1 Tax=Streptomyces sp. BK022 TaxID=2512123 RepID=UPI001028B3F3|nr:hypothetical protein [Streptomyces sp. BK022]RZU44810.1 hypothetical protein EV284_2286 [Streptomyces sp. BK022]